MEETVWQKVMYGLTMRSYKEVAQQFAEVPTDGNEDHLVGEPAPCKPRITSPAAIQGHIRFSSTQVQQNPESALSRRSGCVPAKPCLPLS
jgi:hypothetical protein